MTAIKVIELALFCVAAGFITMVVRLRRWEAREAKCNAPSEMVTFAARLAPGVSNATELFAQGHAKAAPRLVEHGVQVAYVIRRENDTDTSATVTTYLRCQPRLSDFIQSSYGSYFPGGQLSFFAVKPNDDPFLQLHIGLISGHEPDEGYQFRLQALGFIKRLKLA
jgi:hypothetical protein